MEPLLQIMRDGFFAERTKYDIMLLLLLIFIIFVRFVSRIIGDDVVGNCKTEKGKKKEEVSNLVMTNE